jgi:hypothetical protein
MKDNMAKTLRVVEPFLVLMTGDMFEYDEETNMYVSQRKEEYYENGDSHSKQIKSTFSTNFSISPEYAKDLINEGIIEEATETEQNKTPFVNIFDEIDTLLARYTEQLNDVEENSNDLPACMKIERETVLNNMITLLKHLKSLKK